MKSTPLRFHFVNLFFALCLVRALPAADPASVTLDISHNNGKINPLVFGHNIEASDARGIFGEPFDAARTNPVSIKYGNCYWNPQERCPHRSLIDATKRVGIGMMRYPGGCLAHRFDWRKAVGPLAERGEWQFGVDEFIELCRALGAEPMITLSDYVLPLGELPQHQADFIEYLNAPATPEHPWAMKRAEWGHPEPYGVKYFELGNETDHGNHNCLPKRVYSPEEYAQYVSSVARAIREVDPTVKLGVVTVPSSGENYDCDWNMELYRNAAKEADFLVVHFYGANVGDMPVEKALPVAMSYSEQLADRMAMYRKLAKKYSGKDLKLAITEFNIAGGELYRRSYLAGLMVADLLRLFLQPENGVETANYWHVVGGVFGMMVADYQGKIHTRFATLPFWETLTANLGDELLFARVENSPRGIAPGGPALSPAEGDKLQPLRAIGTVDPGKFNFRRFRPLGIEAEVPRQGELRFHFRNVGRNNYSQFATFPRPEALPLNQSGIVRMTFEARFTPTGADGNGGLLGLGLGDARGWEQTKSAAAAYRLNVTPGKWKTFRCDYRLLPDTPAIDLIHRIEQVTGKLDGVLEIRNLKFEAVLPETYPAYPEVTVLASRSSDRQTLYAILFNKSADRTIPVELKLPGFATSSAHVTELYQDDVASNRGFEPAKFELPVVDGRLKVELKPHSMTAFRFER